MGGHYQDEQWALATLSFRDEHAMGPPRAPRLQEGDISSDIAVHERLMGPDQSVSAIQYAVPYNDADRTANLSETDKNPLLRPPSVAETSSAEEYDNGWSSRATASGRSFRMWNPIWLQTGVLAGFAIIFTLSFLATILLYHFSEEHHGLSVESASREYAWRYGPTAFLTVILSLWNQVDFATRTLTPWKGLRDGPSAAERTLLLDYVSPLMLTVLWKSMKTRHWAVLTSIFGILLIQLAVCASNFSSILPTSLTPIRLFSLVASSP